MKTMAEKTEIAWTDSTFNRLRQPFLWIVTQGWCFCYLLTLE